MTRIGNWGQQQLYLARLADIQQRIQTEQVQVATQKKATAYSKLSSSEVNLSIVYENERSIAKSYVQNNTLASTKLKAASTSIDSIRTSLTQFRDGLRKFGDGNPEDEKNVRQIQDLAFRTMQDLQASLNTNVNGQFIFAGGRVNTAPIELPATSLSAFQSLYDGASSLYPASRSLNMAQLNIGASDTGDVIFDAANGVLVPTNPLAYADVPVGSYVTVDGTASNDAPFTIRSHAATNSSGAALTETTDAAVSPGATAFITTSAGTPVDNSVTGNLEFSFDADGQMMMGPTAPGALSPSLAVGDKFTIAGSTNGDYDGAYEVTAYDSATGKMTIKNDLDMAATGTVDSALLTFGAHTDADGVADTVVGPAAFAGDAAISLSGNRVTFTLPAGADLTLTFAPNDLVTIGGSTTNHNGTFTVAAVTANTISFDINPDSLRVTQFLPQSGRTDVGITFDDPVTGRQTDIDSSDTNKYDPVTLTNEAVPMSGYGTLSFSPDGSGGETITASNPDSFIDPDGNAYPAVGTIITLTSVTGVNDGVYEVVSNDKTNIVVRGRPVVNETATAATMTSSNWYKGDTIALQHRAAADRTIDIGVYASDPAFEKALRALANIAQGAFGTGGGLENHSERIQESLSLIQDAIERQGNPDLAGTEMVGDLNMLQANIGFTTSRLDRIDVIHKSVISMTDTRLADIQGADMSETITKLMADQTALEAAYQTIATVRKTSLLDFLK